MRSAYIKPDELSKNCENFKRKFQNLCSKMEDFQDDDYFTKFVENYQMKCEATIDEIREINDGNKDFATRNLAIDPGRYGLSDAMIDAGEVLMKSVRYMDKSPVLGGIFIAGGLLRIAGKYKKSRN